MKVLIYADEGVSSFSFQETLKTFRSLYAQVEAVDHKILNEEPWEKETFLLVIPGGRDIPYDRKLKGKGTDKIKRFVEAGGNYIGICAGAYFGAREVIFEKGKKYEVHEFRDLCFFPGKAIGTLYEHAPFSYDSEEGSHCSLISFGGETLNIYYNGGCTFKEVKKSENISTLATFEDANGMPAIIRCNVGKGIAILSGIHFEVSPEGLKNEGGKSEMVKLLKDSNTKREELISSLLKSLRYESA